MEVETSGRRLPLGELEYSKAGACHSTWASSREWVSLQAPPPHARQAPLHPCEREVRSLLPPPPQASSNAGIIPAESSDQELYSKSPSIILFMRVPLLCPLPAAPRQPPSRQASGWGLSCIVPVEAAPTVPQRPPRSPSSPHGPPAAPTVPHGPPAAPAVPQGPGPGPPSTGLACLPLQR